MVDAVNDVTVVPKMTELSNATVFEPPDPWINSRRTVCPSDPAVKVKVTLEFNVMTYFPTVEAMAKVLVVVDTVTAAVVGIGV